ncbi:MAG: urease accessory protein UreE [Rhodobiaceae bacterium]|jgi:urease accessory protein
MHIAQTIEHHLHTDTAQDTVTLDYEARFIRRKKLISDGGEAFLVELAETRSVNEGEGFQLDDGRVIAIRAASEPLLAIRHENLPRIAWHIGNRHTPCAICGDHLLIRDDPVLQTMLEQLGASVSPLTAPFRPEGGAYGHGRTHGHQH